MPRSRAPKPEPEPQPAAPGDPPPAAPADAAAAQDAAEALEDLSFQQARTALDLTLMQLQAADLDVEQMIGLYRRGQRYADRCEAVLQQVEQEVMLWSGQDAGSEPTPYQP